MKWTLPTNERLLRIAAVMALVALLLMVWSVFDPTVWPLMIALTLGQGIGTFSFVIFLFVVGRDLAVARKLRRNPDARPPE